MKTTAVRSLSISALVAGLTTFGFTGCTKRDRVDARAKTGEVVADTKDALSQGWDNVKSFTFEKRDDFRANAKALTAKMDARMSELHANYSEAKASASRKAAMAEIKDSDVAWGHVVKRESPTAVRHRQPSDQLPGKVGRSLRVSIVAFWASSCWKQLWKRNGNEMGNETMTATGGTRAFIQIKSDLRIS
jgi:hypothetical protein